MRPKNLKFPFTWDQKQPAFHEGVLFVPRSCDRWEMLEKVLPKDPLCIEYCSGNGDWIINQAQTYSTRFWIAVEKQFDRVRKIWSKMHNAAIHNLLIVCGEAATFTRNCVPQNSIEEAYVNFPDPWPKRRHAKHRLIQSSFIETLSQTVKPGGMATYVTDDPPYCLQMIEEMVAHSNWDPFFPKPYYVNDCENYGQSWFETLWRKKGRSVYYTRFKKICN